MMFKQPPATASPVITNILFASVCHFHHCFLMTWRDKERSWWIRAATWQVTNKMWEGWLVENNHCKIFRLIKLGLFLTYFPSASVPHAGSSKASHRYCHLIIKTCNWSGSVSTRGSSAGMELCECEKFYFYPSEHHSVRCSLPLPLGDISHNLEGVFLQTMD